MKISRTSVVIGGIIVLFAVGLYAGSYTQWRAFDVVSVEELHLPLRPNSTYQWLSTNHIILEKGSNVREASQGNFYPVMVTISTGKARPLTMWTNAYRAGDYKLDDFVVSGERDHLLLTLLGQSGRKAILINLQEEVVAEFEVAIEQRMEPLSGTNEWLSIEYLREGTILSIKTLDGQTKGVETKISHDLGEYLGWREGGFWFLNAKQGAIPMSSDELLRFTIRDGDFVFEDSRMLSYRYDRHLFSVALCDRYLISSFSKSATLIGRVREAPFFRRTRSGKDFSVVTDFYTGEARQLNLPTSAASSIRCTPHHRTFSYLADEKMYLVKY